MFCFPSHNIFSKFYLIKFTQSVSKVRSEVYLRVARRSSKDQDQWVPIKYRSQTRLSRSGHIVAEEWSQLLAPGLLRVANTVIGGAGRGSHSQNVPKIIHMFVAGKVDDDDDNNGSGNGGEDEEDNEEDKEDQSASKILDVMEHREKRGTNRGEEHPADHPSHHGILSALAFLDREATKHGLVYRLAFGSLLGQTRGGRIIPHDTDADTVVTYDALVRKCLSILCP